MSLRHLATTIFDAGKLNQNIDSKNYFFQKPRIFIPNKYSFFKNPEYTFRTNINFLKSTIFIKKKLINYYFFLKSQICIQQKYSFFKRDRIGQGYLNPSVHLQLPLDGDHGDRVGCAAVVEQREERK